MRRKVKNGVIEWTNILTENGRERQKADKDLIEKSVETDETYKY